jgi:hypothetical protein
VRPAEIGYASRPVTTPRQPCHDSIELPEPAWQDLPLGAGQEPRAHNTIQFTHDGDPYRRTDVRRKPEEDHWYVLHRPVNGAPA